MSIQSEITRISGNVSDALDAIQAKGVDVPSGSTSDDLATLIALISGGGSGIVITETPDPAGGTIVEITGEELVLQSKTTTPSTSSQLIEPDEGYTALSSVRVNPIPSQYIIPTGTKTITQNGTGIDVAQYAAVNVSVSSPGTNLEDITGVDPTESSQTIVADTGYDGMSSVQINAISSSYVGSGITRRSSSDLTASGATITVPSGYYASSASKSVSSGTAGTPTASKGTVSNHSISVTPSVTNTTGYITGGTKTGTAVTVSASELVSGTKQISANGTSIDVTNYATVDVAVPASTPNLQAKTNISPTEASQTIQADSGYDGLSSVQINAISSTYIGSDITQRSSSDLTASGATVTTPAGYYAEAATKSVSSMTLPTSASSSATSGYTSKATISRSTSDQYVNIPTGYNSSGAYYKVSAVANGSATAPASISGSSATVSTGTNTLTLSKTVSVTPSVTAGYISSGTAGNSSVSLTASVTTKGAATYNTSTSDQTISASQYLTGAQTIKAVTTSNLTAANIKAGTTVTVGDANDADRIAGVTGTFTSDANATASDIVSGKSGYVNGSKVDGSLVIQHYYTGSTAPSSSLGVNGDIYLQTS